MPGVDGSNTMTFGPRSPPPGSAARTRGFRFDAAEEEAPAEGAADAAEAGADASPASSGAAAAAAPRTALRPGVAAPGVGREDIGGSPVGVFRK
jgi:hypothetical protein